MEQPSAQKSPGQSYLDSVRVQVANESQDQENERLVAREKLRQALQQAQTVVSGSNDLSEFLSLLAERFERVGNILRTDHPHVLNSLTVGRAAEAYLVHLLRMADAQKINADLVDTCNQAKGINSPDEGEMQEFARYFRGGTWVNEILELAYPELSSKESESSGADAKTMAPPESTIGKTETFVE
jgi:hypothetical protein